MVYRFRIAMRKRGVMTIKQIVWLVGLVLSLAVILIFFGAFPFAGQTAKEACFQSVLQRSTFNIGPFEPGKSAIPLKCSTEKICVTKSGELCVDAFGTKSGENPITKESARGDAREVVLETLANAMLDCNTILGEGRLDFLPRETFEANYCLICSRIEFDEAVRQEIGSMHYAELYRYLEQEKAPDGRSYLSNIYPGWKDADTARLLFGVIQKSNPDSDLAFEDWKIDLGNEQAVVAQMIIEGRIVTYIATAGAIVGVVALAAFPYVGVPILALGVLKTAAGVGAITYFYSSPSGNAYAPPTIYPYDEDTLKGLGCNRFEVAP